MAIENNPEARVDGQLDQGGNSPGGFWIPIAKGFLNTRNVQDGIKSTGDNSYFR